MSSKLKYHKLLNYLFLFVILIGCQFQDTKKTHGIIYLENRSKALDIKKSNKNDVIKIMGQPQIKSFEDENMWIYAERILTKGKFHNLSQKGFLLIFIKHKFYVSIRKVFYWGDFASN